MKVNTPSVVPIGTERQLTPAITRLNVRDVCRARQRPERIVRMPVVQPNTSATEPMPTNIQPTKSGACCGGGRPGPAGGPIGNAPFSIMIPITM